MPSTNNGERIPEVVIFVRHSADCKFKDEGDQYRDCRCRKHLRYSYRGEQNRVSAKTRSWSQAEKQRVNLLKQFGVTDDPILEPTDRTTISQAAKLFLTRKRTENASAGVVKKYERELHRLSKFCSAKGKLFPEALTLPLLEEFRATWASEYPSTQTRARVQQRLKGFLNFCHDARYLSHVPRLSAIKVDVVPTLPLSDQEFDDLLAKVPEIFSDDEKARKVRALVRLMRFSGLAITDAITLERGELRRDAGGKKYYRVVTSRTKTGVHISVVIPNDVADECLKVLNGNPKYFFWNGTAKVQSAVTNWQHDLRALFRATFGEKTDFTPHCLRDTFAVELLIKGRSIEDVSKALGHASIKVTEKSYSPWVKGRQDRLDSAIAATWEQN